MIEGNPYSRPRNHHRCEAPLEPGFSVLTGETGAGKTMVVTALGMLLGARSDASSVRNGAKSALAEAVIRPPRAPRPRACRRSRRHRRRYRRTDLRAASGTHRQRLGTLPRPRRRLLRTHRNPVSDWSDSCCSPRPVRSAAPQISGRAAPIPRPVRR